LGLELSGEASAEPAIASESAVAVAMTAIALNFMVPPSRKVSSSVTVLASR